MDSAEPSGKKTNNASKWPRPRIHLLTAIILQIVLSLLIWLNVRPVENSRAKWGWPFPVYELGSSKHAPPYDQWRPHAPLGNVLLAGLVVYLTWRIGELLLYPDRAKGPPTTDNGPMTNDK